MEIKQLLTKAIDNISLSVDNVVNLLPLWVQVVQEKLLYLNCISTIDSVTSGQIYR